MSDASEAPVTHYDATGNPINNCAHDWQRRASNFDNSGTARRKRELGAAQSYLWQAERGYELRLSRARCATPCRVARYRWVSIFQPGKRGTYRRQRSGVRITIQAHTKPY